MNSYIFIQAFHPIPLLFVVFIEMRLNSDHTVVVGDPQRLAPAKHSAPVSTILEYPSRMAVISEGTSTFLGRGIARPDRNNLLTSHPPSGSGSQIEISHLYI